MPIIFWDASGLAKHYYSENGSEAVDAIFQAVPHSDMQVTLWGYAETFAILHRKRNAGSLVSADMRLGTLNPEMQTTQETAARMRGRTT